MSAYILNKEHIDCLIDAALTGGYHGSDFSYYHDGDHHRVTVWNAEEIGTMLWEENVKSVAYRYQDSNIATLPGPAGGPSLPYKHSHIPLPVDPVVVLKAIQCYDYQTCEHPGWKTSEAHSFCRALEHTMVVALPGYEDGPGWDITSRTQYQQRPKSARLHAVV